MRPEAGSALEPVYEVVSAVTSSFQVRSLLTTTTTLLQNDSDTDDHSPHEEKAPEKKPRGRQGDNLSEWPDMKVITAFPSIHKKHYISAAAEWAAEVVVVAATAIYQRRPYFFPHLQY